MYAIRSYYAPALLAQAQAAALEPGLGNISFVRANVTAVPLSDSSIDLASCGYSVHHFGDPAAALAEAARVLRPGGRLALIDLIVPGDPSSYNFV